MRVDGKYGKYLEKNSIFKDQIRMDDILQRMENTRLNRDIRLKHYNQIGAIQERPNEDAKKPGHEEDLDQMELDQNKENVRLRGLEGLAQPNNGVWTSKEESLHKHGVKAHQSSWDTAQGKDREDPAQQKKPTSLFAPKVQKKETMDVELDQEEGEADTAQEEEAQDVFKGPLTQSRAVAQRKPILQVAWAWLRRKRKPRRVNQLGLF